MLMKGKKIKLKILYSFILGSFIFGNSIGTAQALFGGGPKIPSVESIMDKAENRYGFDENILRSSSRKGDYPTAEIFFDKIDPEKGEKVTATAMPKYFRNSEENLYFTWFLFKEGDTLSDSDAMENAKRRAMGIVARGDFDPFLFQTDYTTNPTGDPDNDGYEASFGGDDGTGGKKITPTSIGDYEAQHYADEAKQIVDGDKITRCYRHNFGVSNPDNSSYNIAYPGGDLIVECKHKFPTAKDGDSFSNPYDSTLPDVECNSDYKVGDGVFETNEEACWRLNPDKADTDGDGFKDEADLAGLGQSQLTWTFNPGDRVGVIIEGTSMVPCNSSAATSYSGVVLSEVITSDCIGFVDGTYCLDASLNIGECSGGVCASISDCTGQVGGTACEVPGTGVCKENYIISTCVAPLIDGDACTDGTITGVCAAGDCLADICQSVGACSADGDLCEQGGIAGTCNSGVCVLSQCVTNGSPCQTDLGMVGSCSSGFCLSNTISNSDASLNPYFKILWGGIDICDLEQVEGVNKDDLIKNDECSSSGDTDYGFTYLATRLVSEKGKEALASNLNFSPAVPQLNEANKNYSDYITVSSDFTQKNIDDSFIYYDWDIYYCGTGDSETCTQVGTSLASSCVDGDVLGECASDIISDSYAEGLGVDEIKFKLGDDFIVNQGAGDNFYLKVFLKTKENKNDSSMGISSVDIPVVLNDNVIRFFKVSKKVATGKYGFDDPADEICTAATDGYDKICPVFPGQVIAAKVEIDSDTSGDVLGDYSFSWGLNNEKLVAPQTGSTACSFDTGCSLGDVVYLPMSGDGMELQSISLKAQKKNGDEITSERIISVAEPMAKIKSLDLLTAKPWLFDDGSATGKDSEIVFAGVAGENVSLDANLVPSYLDAVLTANDISFVWYFDGQEVDTDFITNNPGYGMITPPVDQYLSFTLDKEKGDSMNIVVEVKKDFSSDDKTLLSENWGIKNLKTIENKKSITLKVTDDAEYLLVLGSSMRAFTASTLDNASEYIVFIIRTAIVFVLFWFFLFGFNYWFSQEVSLKK